MTRYERYLATAGAVAEELLSGFIARHPGAVAALMSLGDLDLHDKHHAVLLEVLDSVDTVDRAAEGEPGARDRDRARHLGRARPP